MRNRIGNKTNLRPLLVRLNPGAVKLPLNRLPILLTHFRQNRLFELRRYTNYGHRLQYPDVKELGQLAAIQKRLQHMISVLRDGGKR